MYEEDFVLGEKNEDANDLYEDLKQRSETGKVSKSKHQDASSRSIDPKANVIPMPDHLTIHRGRVRAIKSFGIFVELSEFPGLSVLVPKRHVASYDVEDMTKEVDVRQHVYVKVPIASG